MHGLQCQPQKAIGAILAVLGNLNGLPLFVGFLGHRTSGFRELFALARHLLSLGAHQPVATGSLRKFSRVSN
jgi:hypothetical protein